MTEKQRSRMCDFGGPPGSQPQEIAVRELRAGDWLHCGHGWMRVLACEDEGTACAVVIRMAAHEGVTALRGTAEYSWPAGLEAEKGDVITRRRRR